MQQATERRELSRAVIGAEDRSCMLCRGAVQESEEGFCCVRCRRVFPRSARGQGDFRLQDGEVIRAELEYRARRYDVPLALLARRERPCEERRNGFRGDAPWHLTRDQISYIPEARANEVALDLGCGAGIHRDLLEELGYAYHGADFQGDAAIDLVDAHALPYRDQRFDLVLAIALLEHIAQPFMVLREAGRVLKRDCLLVGTVAFLEPFHDNSFFHFSPLGLANALEESGLTAETVLAIRGWNVVRAQLEMGFERAPLPRSIPNALSRPFVALAEAYALVGRLAARDKSRHTRDVVHSRHAGAFFYVARKR